MLIAVHFYCCTKPDGTAENLVEGTLHWGSRFVALFECSSRRRQRGARHAWPQRVLPGNSVRSGDATFGLTHPKNTFDLETLCTMQKHRPILALYDLSTSLHPKHENSLLTDRRFRRSNHGRHFNRRRFKASESGTQGRIDFAGYTMKKVVILRSTVPVSGMGERSNFCHI